MARFQKMIFKFALMIALGMAVHFSGSTLAQGKGKGKGKGPTAVNAKVDKGDKRHKKKDDKKPHASKKEQLSKKHKREGKALAHGKDKEKGKGHGLAHGKDKEKEKGKGHGLAHGKDKEKGKGHGHAHGKDKEEGKGYGLAHGKDKDKEKGKGHGLALGKEKRKGALAALSAKLVSPEILKKAARAKAKPGKAAKERRKHLKRMAKIRRLIAIAKAKGNTALLEKITVLTAKEKERHQKARKRLAEKKSHKG